MLVFGDERLIPTPVEVTCNSLLEFCQEGHSENVSATPFYRRFRSFS